MSTLGPIFSFDISVKLISTVMRIWLNLPRLDIHEEELDNRHHIINMHG